MTTIKSKKGLKQFNYILNMARDTIGSRDEIDKGDTETLELIEKLKESLDSNLLIQIG